MVRINGKRKVFHIKDVMELEYDSSSTSRKGFQLVSLKILGKTFQIEIPNEEFQPILKELEKNKLVKTY